MGAPIRTSVGKPKSFDHEYLFASTLAPYALFREFRDAPDDVARFIYFDQLHKNETKIVTWFKEFADTYSGVPGVLLCYENVAKGQSCHRRWFADWAADTLGWDVPEIGT